MAKALKCDRCGKFFQIDDIERLHGKDEKVYYIVHSLFGPTKETMYDICPDCYDQLKCWMEGKFNIMKREEST